jgi:hypothetical protein
MQLHGHQRVESQLVQGLPRIERLRGIQGQHLHSAALNVIDEQLEPLAGRRVVEFLEQFRSGGRWLL